MSYTQDYELLLESSVLDLFGRLFSTNKNIEDCPRVSFNEMLEKPRKGDIVSTYLKSSAFPTTFRLISSRVVGLAQGGRWTSLKAFKDKETIIGYGVEVSKKSFDRDMIVTTNSFKTYLKKAGGAILLRPKNISQLQIDKFISYMDERLGRTYGYKEVVSSFFERIIENTKNMFSGDLEKQKQVAKKFIESFKDHLFCSNIIALAYDSVKYNTKLGVKSLLSWPVDFINSQAFEKVCVYKSS